MQATNKDNQYRRSLEGLDQLLAADFGRKVYVDFDHTLFCANSTEEFVKSGRPAVASVLIRGLLKAMQPWALGPRKEGRPLWRDPIRVWATILSMPWTLWFFRRRASSLFKRLSNQELMFLLHKVPKKNIVVISLGFEWLIRDLLQGSALSDVEVIGSSIFRPLRMHQMGKLDRLRQVGHEPEIARDVFITDSLEDRDLLDSVYAAYLIKPCS